MYKATVRWLIRRNIAGAERGRLRARVLADVRRRRHPHLPRRQLVVPPVPRRPSRAGPPIPTHRGRAEIEAFLRRYVDHGIQMEVEDMLVNGPPWNTRAAVRVHDWIPGDRRRLDGDDLYANRAVLMVDSRWGRIRDQEDYEDSERVAGVRDPGRHPRLTRRARSGGVARLEVLGLLEAQLRRGDQRAPHDGFGFEDVPAVIAVGLERSRAHVRRSQSQPSRAGAPSIAWESTWTSANLSTVVARSTRRTPPAMRRS